LHCLWCCNPESQAFAPEIEFLESHCQHCGQCIAACPKEAIYPDPFITGMEKIDRQRCDHCGECVLACPHEALRMLGEWRTVEQVLAEILRDADYYRKSGGGVTISGGEPLAQPAFTRLLLEACYDHNLHTAVETSGCVQWPLYESILPFSDLFLFDLKQMDSQLHRRLTGVPNETILENLRRLGSSGAALILRLPLIPGCNTSEAHFNAVAELAASVRAAEIHLMPFHQLGKDKYLRLGRTYSLDGEPGLRENPQGKEILRIARQILEARGLTVHVGG
jgi:pyruvate formate lyase activating enzyme